MLKYLESPHSQLPYLELFQSGGGASQGVFWGGQSRDVFRGGPVKKITLYIAEGPVRGRRQRGGYFPEPIQGQLPGPSIPGNDFLFQMHQPRLTL